jgi:nucleoside-triphosphatase
MNPNPEAPIRLAVTGPPGCGKSTLCIRVASALKARGVGVGGFTTAEVRGPGGDRAGFELRDLAAGRSARLASVEFREGPRVGKYRVDLAAAGLGARALREAMARADLWLVVDEVAPMELASPELSAALADALDSPAHLLASLHLRSDHPILRRFREACEVHRLDPGNRDVIARRLLDKVIPGVGGA